MYNTSMYNTSMYNDFYLHNYGNMYNREKFISSE